MSDIKPALMWRPVVGFEGLYEVSDTGLVRRLAGPDAIGRPRKGRVLKQVVDRGYRRVSLCRNCRPTNISVHKVVAEAFIGPRPSVDHVVNHRDGVKSNNGVTNLEYVTRSENDRHAVRMGLKAQGEGHGMVKLRDTQVQAIRREYANGLSTTRLCALTTMSHRQISRIVRGSVRLVG